MTDVRVVRVVSCPDCYTSGGVSDVGSVRMGVCVRCRGSRRVEVAVTCGSCTWYSWPDNGSGDCGKLKQSVAETFGCAAWEAKR